MQKVPNVCVVYDLHILKYLVEQKSYPLTVQLQCRRWINTHTRRVYYSVKFLLEIWQYIVYVYILVIRHGKILMTKLHITRGREDTMKIRKFRGAYKLNFAALSNLDTNIDWGGTGGGWKGLHGMSIVINFQTKYDKGGGWEAGNWWVKLSE